MTKALMLNNNIFSNLKGLNNVNVKLLKFQKASLFEVILLALLMNVNPDLKELNLKHQDFEGLYNLNDLNTLNTYLKGIFNKTNTKILKDDKELNNDLNLLVNFFVKWYLMEKHSLLSEKTGESKELVEFKSIKKSLEGNKILVNEFLKWVKKVINKFDTKFYERAQVKKEFLKDLKEYFEKDANRNRGVLVDIEILKSRLKEFLEKRKDYKKLLKEVIANGIKEDKGFKKFGEEFEKKKVKWLGDERLIQKEENFSKKLDNFKVLIKDDRGIQRIKTKKKGVKKDIEEIQAKDLSRYKDSSSVVEEKIVKKETRIYELKKDKQGHLIGIRKYLNISKEEVRKGITDFKEEIKSKGVDGVRAEGNLLKSKEVFDSGGNINEILLNVQTHTGLEDRVGSVHHVRFMEGTRLSNDFLQFVKNLTLEVLPQGEKKAFLKLEPPDLGSLDLEIKIKDKDVRIVVRADRVEVLNELRNNINHIKNSLQEMGLNLRDFQFYLGSGMESGYFDSPEKRENDNFLNSSFKEVEEVGKPEPKQVLVNRNGKIYYIV